MAYPPCARRGTGSHPSASVKSLAVPGIHLRSELRALLALAVPVVASRAGLLVMTTVNTVMTGWAGGDELAYLAIGLAPFIFLMLVGTGLLTGTVVLVAQAHGAGEGPSCGRIWHAALVDALLAGLLAILALRHTEWFLLAFGQTPSIAAGGGEVAWMLALGMPAMLGYVATTLFLEGLGQPRVGVFVIVLGNLLNIPLNHLLIHGGLGLPAMGAAGAALATTVVRWLMLLLIVGYVLASPSVRAFGSADGFQPCRRLQAKLLRLGVPFAVSQGLETSAFQGLALFCGWLGATALAAYQISLNVTALVFMATVGLSTATAVRVGRGIGAGEPARAMAAAWLGFGSTLAAMLALAPLIALGAPAIAGFYTADPRVLELAVGCLGLVAVVVVVDGAQGVLTGALRGAADVWRPMAIHVASFWLVLLPAAWILAFPLGLGVEGLLGGVVAGLAAAALLLALRLKGLPAQGLARA
jgi:multidrug resistance protein, MATE family